MWEWSAPGGGENKTPPGQLRPGGAQKEHAANHNRKNKKA
jgi:hypothetical protein